ncbi:MAG: M4 family metallopeptidase [Acidobacteriota bacterium]
MKIRPANLIRRCSIWLVVLGLALLGGSTLARYAETGPHAMFAQLQSRAAGPLEAHWNDVTGIPDFLSAADSASSLPYSPSAAERGNPVAIARGFLDENRGLFRLTSAADELKPVRVEPDLQLQYAHVRLAQTYHGIPVFGKQLIVHLNSKEQVTTVNGQFSPAIDVATRASISREEAERAALDDLLQVQLDEDERARVTVEVLTDQTQLMVYVDGSGKATLTWNVIIMTDSPLGQWTYFVNAGRPAVVYRFDSAEHIKQRRTFSADNRASVPGRIVIEEGERAKSDAIAQAAHDGAGKVYDYYFNTFKRDGIDGQGSPMISTVHYGNDPQDAENAAWIGQRQQMIYGDGGRIMKPLSYGLDVVGHEFTHGVTDGTAGLIYAGQSGALNESYSDIFAAMIDRGNWTIGEAIVKSPPFPIPYLRNLEDPSAGGNYNPSDPLSSVGQPSKMSEYANLPLSRKADNGGVHVNSGIPNRAAFLVARAIGKEKMEQIYYRTLTQYLSPNSNFQDAARATVRSATELYGATEANAVRDAFSQVGINVTGGGTTPVPQTAPTTQRGPAAPPPPQTNTAGCTGLVVNGNFENPDTGWTEVSTAHSAIIDTELPHTGSRSAWLGGTDKEPVQVIYQEIRIPANATNVKLAYWRLIHEETSGLLGFLAAEAQFSTVLMNSAGEVQAVIETNKSSVGDDTWRQANFDLSQFAGKTVRLAFAAENPKNNVSSFFIDDVDLTACTTGDPVPQKPSSNDLVYIQGVVKNADTGRGIAGAQFFVLKPGQSATDAAADDSVTRSEVLAMGTSDASGLYKSDIAIPRGQNYSVIVIARGFRPIVADDGLKVPSNATSPFTANANLRPGR